MCIHEYENSVYIHVPGSGAGTEAVVIEAMVGREDTDAIVKF